MNAHASPAAHLPRFGRTERIEIRQNFAQETMDDLREAYLADARPWVVGFSGGKDSTALASFVFHMLGRLPRDRRLKPVFVLASDTRVETPTISHRIVRELSFMAAAAERDGLPVTTHLVFPKLNDTFWVNLIGRGYPSPNSQFRWCTDRLKIYPVSAFIRSVVDRSGAVVVVLGSRRGESDTRSRAMDARAIEGQRFRPHSELPKAWVYTPLEGLSANEVWTYLLQVPSPWSGDNLELITLYKRAAGGECPLVIDMTTPSCGQSRFGCWTCTVIEKDRSMESLVEMGEEHLTPLLDLRDYIAEVRNKPGARYDYRRNGKKAINRHTGEAMTNTGPFTHETRMDILRRLLQAQKQSSLPLIEGDELAIIQEIWSREENDHPDKSGIASDAVSQIWLQIYGGTEMTEKQDTQSIEETLLRKTCEEQGIPFEMMRDLTDIEERFGHLKRRHGLPDEMRDIVRQALKKLGEEA